MAQLITLNFYHAEQRQYHVRRASGSAVDGQTHYHDYYQVCYVTQGRILHYREREAVALKKGEAFVIPPGFLHSLHFETADTQVLSLAFRDSLFHEGFKLSNIAGFLGDLQRDMVRSQLYMRITLNQRQGENVQRLLEMLIAEQAAENMPGLCAAPSLISSVLYMLAQGYYGARAKDMEAKQPRSYADTMQHCADYIDRNYAQKLSLDSLARRFGVSRSAFCTAFRQYTGLSPRQYIARRRIQEAQICIRAGQEVSLSRIAQSVGYEDDSTFYRNFLQVTGMSPARYRQLCRKTEQI